MNEEEKISRVECPFCNQAVDVAYDFIVDADTQPNERAAILSGDFFRWTCPHCGRRVRLCQRMLYCDKSHRFLVFWEPGATEDLRESNEAVCNLPEFAGYKRRVVADINQFKEKILLLEADIDDRALELTKSVLSNLVYQKYGKAIRAAYFNKFDEVEDTVGISFQLMGEGRMIQFQTKLEVYRLAIELADKYDAAHPNAKGFRMIDGHWADTVFAWDKENT